MEFLQQLLDATDVPLFSAFLLGLIPGAGKIPGDQQVIGKCPDVVTLEMVVERPAVDTPVCAKRDHEEFAVRRGRLAPGGHRGLRIGIAVVGEVVGVESRHPPDRDSQTVGLDVGVGEPPDDVVVGGHLEDITPIGLGDEGVAVGQPLCAGDD